MYGTLVGERLPFRVYDGHLTLVSLGFVEHVPCLIHRPTWEAAITRRPDRLDLTRSTRFRLPTDLRMEFLYRQYLLARPEAIEVVPFWRQLKVNRLHKITNDLAVQRKGFDRLRRVRPRFYCLNDDQREDPDPDVSALVQAFLDEWYPDPSSFEKTMPPSDAGEAE